MVRYRAAEIDGRKVFYREAGNRQAPTILLLHGFPPSSHMFRNLIPLLADRYHVIAPDLPGFGFSDAPDRAQFKYTFDNLRAVFLRTPHGKQRSIRSKASICTNVARRPLHWGERAGVTMTSAFPSQSFVNAGGGPCEPGPPVD